MKILNIQMKTSLLVSLPMACLSKINVYIKAKFEIKSTLNVNKKKKYMFA